MIDGTEQAGDRDDIDRLQHEVDQLTAELVDYERLLIEATNELASFEATYRKVIASRLSRVERLKAELAALEGDESDDAAARAEAAARVAEELTPKERFHAMARRIHPDLSVDEDDRKSRDDLMKRLNEAWEKQDVDGLDLIEAEVERNFPSGSTREHRWTVLTRAHALLAARVVAVQDRLEAKHSTALWMLMQRVRDARAHGRSLLDEQAAELDEMATSLEREIVGLHERQERGA